MPLLVLSPGKGHLYVYGYDVSGIMTSYLDYAMLPGGGPPLVKTSPILNSDGACEHPVFLHEFATTEHYLIFIDNPLTFGIRKVSAIQGLGKSCMLHHTLLSGCTANACVFRMLQRAAESCSPTQTSSNSCIPYNPALIATTSKAAGRRTELAGANHACEHKCRA